MKKLLSLTALCLSLFLLASCSPQRVDLTPEETHQYCEEYADDVLPWKIPRTPNYRSLKNVVSIAVKPSKMSLCLFEIQSAEEARSPKQFTLTILIKEVYSGDSSLKGTEIKPVVFLEEGDPSPTIGKKYVGYIQPDLSNPRDIVYTSWTYLVTEDNTLVSPFGCQVEESQLDELSIAPWDKEGEGCRRFTGQKLDYFISVVKSLEAELKKEAESSSEKSKPLVN